MKKEISKRTILKKENSGHGQFLTGKSENDNSEKELNGKGQI